MIYCMCCGNRKGEYDKTCKNCHSKIFGSLDDVIVSIFSAITTLCQQRKSPPQEPGTGEE